MSKGPYKIILTTSDFVFPQVPPVDSRTVSEIPFGMHDNTLFEFVYIYIYIYLLYTFIFTYIIYILFVYI
jgi:hypothetical protein